MIIKQMKKILSSQKNRRKNHKEGKMSEEIKKEKNKKEAVDEKMEQTDEIIELKKRSKGIKMN